MSKLIWTETKKKKKRKNKTLKGWIVVITKILQRLNRAFLIFRNDLSICLFLFCPFLFSLIFYLWSARTVGSLFLFFCYLSLSLVFKSILYDLFVSQNTRDFWASPSSRRILVCAYTIWQYGQILISCTIPCGSPYLPSQVEYCTLFW